MRQKRFNFLTYKASNYDIQGDSVGFVLLLSEQGMRQWSVYTDQQAYSSKGPPGMGWYLRDEQWLQLVPRWFCYRSVQWEGGQCIQIKNDCCLLGHL